MEGRRSATGAPRLLPRRSASSVLSSSSSRRLLLLLLLLGALSIAIIISSTGAAATSEEADSEWLGYDEVSAARDREKTRAAKNGGPAKETAASKAALNAASKAEVPLVWNPKEETEDDEICTQSLRDALNAAISQLIGSRQLTDHLLPLWDESGAYVPVMVCGPTVSLDSSASSSVSSAQPLAASDAWPRKEDLQEDDLLSQILRRKKVKVVYPGPIEASRSISYVEKPENPTGLFADATRAVWAAISRHYGVSIEVQFLHASSIEAAQHWVEDQLADVTDLSFPLAHRNENLRDTFDFDATNPLSFLYMTCPLVGTALRAYTRKQDDATSFEKLVTLILQQAKAGQSPKVVVSSNEIRNIVEPILPSVATVSLMKRFVNPLDLVATGEAVAFFYVGPSPPLTIPKGVVSNTGIDIILAHGGWIRRSRSSKCLRREHYDDLKDELTNP